MEEEGGGLQHEGKKVRERRARRCLGTLGMRCGVWDEVVLCERDG